MTKYPLIQLYGWCLKGLGGLTFLGLTVYSLTYVDTDPVGAAIVIAFAAVAGLGIAATGEVFHAFADMSISTQVTAEVSRFMYQKRQGKK